MRNVIRGDASKGSGLPPKYGRQIGNPAEAQHTQSFDDSAINSEAPPTTGGPLKASPKRDPSVSATGRPAVVQSEGTENMRSDYQTLVGNTPDSDKGNREQKAKFLRVYRTEAGETA